ncbi:MAG TPA: GNAT family protein [Thermoleophilia bacterium]|nr:GNAT family protein [Thermoleophilia bacterium]
MTSADIPVLRGPRLILRPLAEADVEPLADIGSTPEVARWWPGISADHLREHIAGGGGSTACAIELDGRTVGMIQFHEEEDDFRHAGLDLFLDPAVHGRGLGGEAIVLLGRHLIEAQGHHRLTIDPALANERAIRCYEKAGFRRVGVLRSYWRDPDGVWRDGLLLDVLADELAQL